MTKRSIFITTAALSLALLSGCAADTLGDKGGQDGAQPDKISDVGRTEVFRNVDSYPNVERFLHRGSGLRCDQQRGRYPRPAVRPGLGVGPELLRSVI